MDVNETSAEDHALFMREQLKITRQALFAFQCQMVFQLDNEGRYQQSRQELDEIVEVLQNHIAEHPSHGDSLFFASFIVTTLCEFMEKLLSEAEQSIREDK